jgi:hypothetical protein
MTLVPKEQRSRPRVPLDSEVVVQRAAERILCRTMDVSSTGIALRSPVPGVPGGPLRLRLLLVPRGEWLTLDGVLVREERSGLGYVWGVRFLPHEPRVSVQLMALVRSQIVKSNRAPDQTPGEQGPAPGRVTLRARERAGRRHALRNLFKAALRQVR